MTRKSSFSVGFYLTLVFISGLLAGALGMRLYIVNSVSARAAIPRPTAEEVRRSYMDEMDRHLHLRADQITSINQVLDNTRARFKEIHQKIAPEMKALKEQQNQQIRSLLTQQQQPAYDRWRSERDSPTH
jgi:hypothetical protein